MIYRIIRCLAIKKLLHPENFSKRFLPSLPSRNIQFKFDPRVLGHPVYSAHCNKFMFYFVSHRDQNKFHLVM
jgi:hypothetical protein